MKKLLALILVLTTAHSYGQFTPNISLNGTWQYGLGRNYTQTADVPSIATDPAKIPEDKVWYKREVTLPQGDWTHAVLELKGARFMPEVYIDGELVSSQNGGMIASFHELGSGRVKPGTTVILEIALTPLDRMPQDDASAIPVADRWRSNVSCSLWDDVVLHLNRGARVRRVLHHFDTDSKTALIRYDVAGSAAKTADIYIKDSSGKTAYTTRMNIKEGSNSHSFSYKDKLKEWTTDEPNLYRMEIVLCNGKGFVACWEQNFGVKEFTVKDKQFFLNGKPCKIRGGTVTWHRAVREEEGRALAYDTDWYLQNIILRLKDHGANLLRFHLGVPPQRLLDLCDRHGLLVQYEWSFFHGMPASYESLMEQYPKWFDYSYRHPSVALYHPYNETDDEELEIAWKALDTIIEDYPPMVLEDRDVIHIHKYWWSMFENVGIFYDTAEDFDRAILVDEFGGNYLDRDGNIGGYPSLRESFMRFLGRNATKQMLFEQQNRSNAKIAEYWRRLGAAGVIPFTINGSHEDGNDWFMGKLKNGIPKPVWEELTVLWSPLAVSMEIWDRNFTPGQQIAVPLYFFNDTDGYAHMEAAVRISDSDGLNISYEIVRESVSPYSTSVVVWNAILPDIQGRYDIECRLRNPPPQVKYPVVSKWDIRVLQAQVPEKVQKARLYIPSNERELLSFASDHGLNLATCQEDSDAVLLSRASWEAIASGETGIGKMVRAALDNNTSVLMFDIGERYLGQGYPENEKDKSFLQGVKMVADPRRTTYEIFDGFSLTFVEAAEPESHLHPAQSNDALWSHLPYDYCWLWNGYKGGLNMPAADMQVHGMSRKAFTELWKGRGADVEKIMSGSYFAYELCGFYMFSDEDYDKGLIGALKKKVRTLVEDAPSLAGSMNPNTPVRITNLGREYKLSDGIAEKFTLMVNAGKSLTRTPVILVGFGKDKGKLMLSQLLTSGRLVKGSSPVGLYDVRYDEAAVQMTLNMINEILTEK